MMLIVIQQLEEFLDWRILSCATRCIVGERRWSDGTFSRASIRQWCDHCLLVSIYSSSDNQLGNAGLFTWFDANARMTDGRFAFRIGFDGLRGLSGGSAPVDAMSSHCGLEVEVWGVHARTDNSWGMLRPARLLVATCCSLHVTTKYCRNTYYDTFPLGLA